MSFQTHSHVAAALLLALSAHGQGIENPTDEITPALLRNWANNSQTMLETYRDYKQIFSEKRRKRYDSTALALVNRPNAFLIMVDFNAVIPLLTNGVNSAPIPTNYGPFDAGIQKSYAAFCVSYLFTETEIGAYILLDEDMVFMEKEDFAGHEFLFMGYGKSDVISFNAGKTITAVFWKSGGLDFNIGMLGRTIPKTGFNSSGQEVFRFELQENGKYEGNDDDMELFLDLALKGYSFNSLYSPKNGLQYFGLGFELGKTKLAFDPFFRYSRYRTRFQSGVTLQKAYNERVTVETEGAADLHRNSSGKMAPYFHALMKTEEVLFRLPHSRLSEFSGYDFHMKIDQGLSASTDILDVFVVGAGAGISLEDIVGLISLRLGAGYNDYWHLSVFPVRNRFILDLRAQFAW